MDALELLAEDHKLVNELFENMEAAEDEKEKRKILREIKTELDTHARLEERIFYRAMKERSELKDMVAESLKEHKQVKTLLREIGKLKSGSDRFDPKLETLIESVKHHAEEEEEGKSFRKLGSFLTKTNLKRSARNSRLPRTSCKKGPVEILRKPSRTRLL